ncbi:hypothetical protein SAMN05444722_1681 [Rhodovulum sp. ES.010]|uniref:DUF6950 family protein n=1 Tax=Rhodovulum sp. ES.010 TaxID=1882821 RepID=UPI00092C8855|nr:hypothetical protein [Rhodovulum sp. ES.010]SIO36351.1 hypothetical protein SAMN05444722_1681 [Rhodovulum sp. ES.010]
MGQRVRVPGWERALTEELRHWEGRAFAWGPQDDCLAMCRAAAVAVTGEDPFPHLPAYATELGAARGLRRLGFASVEAMVSDRLASIPPAQAMRGDWVMVPGGGLVPGAFGVVAGARAAHLGPEGLVWRDVSGAERAWRIG